MKKNPKKNTKKKRNGLKRNFKDTIFTLATRSPKAQRRLAKELPLGVPIRTVELFTIVHPFHYGPHNDLGLIVNNDIIVCIEAQTTEPVNLGLRLLIYAAESLWTFLIKNQLSRMIYSTAIVKTPSFRLFVVYPFGDHDYAVILNDSRDSPQDSDIQLKAQVICKPEPGTLIGEYIEFCRIADRLRKQSPEGWNQKCFQLLCQECEERGILKEMILQYRVELEEVMEQISKMEWERLGDKDAIKFLKKQSRADKQKAAKAEAQNITAIQNLHQHGFSPAEIESIAGFEHNLVVQALEKEKSH